MLGGEPVRPQGPPLWPLDDPAVKEAVGTALADGSWGRYHGAHCETLKEGLAAYHGCEHVVLCASGTAAVELALRGLAVGPGDEVILAAYDFKGNFQDVLAVGAQPVLVDVVPGNWNLDIHQLEAAVGPQTRAVIATHLHGGMVDMPVVIQIAEAAGIPVVEDACQAPGAVVCGRKAGTWGDVGVLSFGGSKLLTAGRGGAFFTNRADIVQRARLYSHRGNEAYPLSELQAAALVPQLDQLDAANEHRAANVARLCDALGGRCGLEVFTNSLADTKPGYYKLGFQYDPREFEGLAREDFVAAMRAEGIALDVGFRALHAIHGSRRYRLVGDLPVAGDADERVVVLHHPVLLGEQGDIDQIAAALDKVAQSARMIREQAKQQ